MFTTAAKSKSSETPSKAAANHITQKQNSTVSESLDTTSIPKVQFHFANGLLSGVSGGASMPPSQAKLKISHPSDPMEKEADAMADQVMSEPEVPSIQTKASGTLQTKCTACEKEEIQEKEEEADVELQAKWEQEYAQPKFAAKHALQRSEEEELSASEGNTPSNEVQLKEVTGKDPPDLGIPKQISNSRGRAPPMDADTCRFMQDRFGADFSDVRIHTDKSANDMAGKLCARAFATGKDLYFAKDQYQPHTKQGRWLLAHELTHTIQQGAVNQQGFAQAKQLQRQTANPSTSSRQHLHLSQDDQAQCDRGPPGAFNSSFSETKHPATISDAISRSNDTTVIQRGFFSDAYDWVASGVESAVNYASDLYDSAAEYLSNLKDELLEELSEFAHRLPGYSLVTVILAEDPITGKSVDRSGINFINAGLDVIPGGTDLKAELEKEGALTEAATWLDEQIATLDFSLSDIEDGFDRFWDSLSVTDVADPEGVFARAASIFEPYITKISTFAINVGSKLLEILKKYIIGQLQSWVKERTDWYPLLTVILGEDPITEEVVERSGMNILKGFILLHPEGEQQLAQMEESGTLQKAADWVDKAIERVTRIISGLKTGALKLWNEFSITDLLTPTETFQQVYDLFSTPVSELISFAVEVAEMIISFIKDALISRLVTFARGIPGYHLVTVILGKDIFSQEKVDRTAENIIKGFMLLLPDGEAQFNQLKESGAIAQTLAWLEGAIAELDLSWDAIVAIFTKAWNDFKLSDLAKPLETFQRVVDLFAAPIGRVIRFVAKVVIKVIEIALRIMGFPFELIGSIISNVQSAYHDIKRDPVAFLKNLLRALKKGVEQFFTNILKHLLNGVSEWLFGQLGDAGITMPKDFSFESILGLVFQILGITKEKIFEKLKKKVGPEKWAKIEKAIDTMTGVWEFVSDVFTRGPAAIWEKIQEKLSSLWDMVISAARNWIMEKIITNVTVKLLSMLDPTGIMAVVNSFIAFFKAVQSAIEYMIPILEMVNRFTSGVAQIAKGNIQSAADFLERTMSKGMPIMIGFLANQVGLGSIGKKIKEVIETIQEKVDSAIQWMIDKAWEMGKNLLEMGQAAYARGRDAVLGLLGLKETFTNQNNHNHSIFFMGDENNLELMIRSDLMPLKSYAIDLKLKADHALSNKVITKAQHDAYLILFKDILGGNYQANADGVIHSIYMKKTAPKRHGTGRQQTTFAGTRAREISTLLNDLADKLAGIPENFQDPNNVAARPEPDIDDTTTHTTSGTPAQLNGNADSTDGMLVEAKVALRAGSNIGSSPSSSGSSNLYDTVSQARKNAYVRGHLLNHHLHGSGGSVNNLTPITHKLNADMKTGPEKAAKNAVLVENQVIYYKIEVDYSPSPDTSSNAALGTIEAEKYLAKSISFELKQMDFNYNTTNKTASEVKAARETWANYSIGSDITFTGDNPLVHDIPYDKDPLAGNPRKAKIDNINAMKANGIADDMAEWIFWVQEQYKMGNLFDGKKVTPERGTLVTKSSQLRAAWEGKGKQFQDDFERVWDNGNGLIKLFQSNEVPDFVRTRSEVANSDAAMEDAKPESVTYYKVVNAEFDNERDFCLAAIQRAQQSGSFNIMIGERRYLIDTAEVLMHAFESAGIDVEDYIQPKLQLSSPNDPLEHEADRMADRVVNQQADAQMQPKCSTCESEEKVQRKCSTCQQEEAVQRSMASRLGSRPPVRGAPADGRSLAPPPQVERGVQSRAGGQQLPDATLSQMNQGFGVDFSDVRIHQGSNAVVMNNALNARAFTVGNDIYFGAHQYHPGTADGDRLIAHELTHTIQQGAVGEQIQRAEVDDVEEEKNLSRDEFRASHARLAETVAEIFLAYDNVYHFSTQLKRPSGYSDAVYRGLLIAVRGSRAWAEKRRRVVEELNSYSSRNILLWLQAVRDSLKEVVRQLTVEVKHLGPHSADAADFKAYTKGHVLPLIASTLGQSFFDQGREEMEDWKEEKEQERLALKNKSPVAWAYEAIPEFVERYPVKVGTVAENKTYGAKLGDLLISKYRLDEVQILELFGRLREEQPEVFQKAMYQGYTMEYLLGAGMSGFTDLRSDGEGFFSGLSRGYKEAMNTTQPAPFQEWSTVDYATFYFNYIAGVPTGALKGALDLVMDIVSLFTPSFWSMIYSLATDEAFRYDMGVAVGFMLVQEMRELESPDPAKLGWKVGKLVGRIAFEVIMSLLGVNLIKFISALAKFKPIASIIQRIASTGAGKFVTASVDVVMLLVKKLKKRLADLLAKFPALTSNAAMSRAIAEVEGELAHAGKLMDAGNVEQAHAITQAIEPKLVDLEAKAPDVKPTAVPTQNSPVDLSGPQGNQLQSVADTLDSPLGTPSQARSSASSSGPSSRWGNEQTSIDVPEPDVIQPIQGLQGSTPKPKVSSGPGAGTGRPLGNTGTSTKLPSRPTSSKPGGTAVMEGVEPLPGSSAPTRGNTAGNRAVSDADTPRMVLDAEAPSTLPVKEPIADPLPAPDLQNTSMAARAQSGGNRPQAPAGKSLTEEAGKFQSNNPTAGVLAQQALKTTRKDRKCGDPNLPNTRILFMPAAGGQGHKMIAFPLTKCRDPRYTPSLPKGGNWPKGWDCVTEEARNQTPVGERVRVKNWVRAHLLHGPTTSHKLRHLNGPGRLPENIIISDKSLNGNMRTQMEGPAIHEVHDLGNTLYYEVEVKHYNGPDPDQYFAEGVKMRWSKVDPTTGAFIGSWHYANIPAIRVPPRCPISRSNYR